MSVRRRPTAKQAEQLRRLLAAQELSPEQQPRPLPAGSDLPPFMQEPVGPHDTTEKHQHEEEEQQEQEEAEEQQEGQGQGQEFTDEMQQQIDDAAANNAPAPPRLSRRR